MSDIERARNTLDAQLASMGYQHPSGNPSNGQGSVYKAYNENKDGDVYVSQDQGVYATFNADKKTHQEVQKTDICPVCDQKAMYACNCPIGEMMCKNNHMWYVEKTGKVVLGDPHENE